MAAIRANSRSIGLLLLLLFLGAQLHVLSDADSGWTGAHPCPVCANVSFAILLALPLLCSLPLDRRAEESLSITVISQDFFRFLSPRAPPLP